MMRLWNCSEQCECEWEWEWRGRGRRVEHLRVQVVVVAAEENDVHLGAALLQR